ncbi:unnamed protein product [Notodromas monacha]|uniref:Nicotinate phosphoribosyltransferase n=1 Tax=Notodromas monacha TaxID=399045 RepID=A0A7R9GCM1_9CRUS|nr:unnamed protein product [Notodromas monacha]CAG0917796.1 unnamed protein product [Notodromas monacha]
MDVVFFRIELHSRRKNRAIVRKKIKKKSLGRVIMEQLEFSDDYLRKVTLFGELSKFPAIDALSMKTPGFEVVLEFMAEEVNFRKSLIEVEECADVIITDRKRIVSLDERRQKDREGLRAMKNADDKVFYCVGSLLMKLPTKRVTSLLEQDIERTEMQLDSLRSGLKKNVETLRRLEGDEALRGFDLKPLSSEEITGLKSCLGAVSIMAERHEDAKVADFVDCHKDFCRCTSRQNGIVQPLLTDLYQITMAYAYWKSGKVEDHAVFDLFFRKNPFQGEFTIFAGLEECVKFLDNFHYSDSDIQYLKETFSSQTDPEFFEFLGNLTAKEITLYAIEEGSVVFPRVPLIRVEGPLIVVQLLETTLLTLVNYASLVATNAARYRIAAGKQARLLEFGLRRAQGPDGGLSASKYTYVGGFDGTSNVLAGKLFGIPVSGTHAHAYVSSYSHYDELKLRKLRKAGETEGEGEDFVEICLKWRPKVSETLGILEEEASHGELGAFISYAIAFPSNFLALVDTYDVTRSGLLNFCAVALALNDLGYRALGVRIDSGDLAYLSCVVRDAFVKIASEYDVDWFAKLTIVASNDINEDTILSLNEQGHKIDAYGIGTHLGSHHRLTLTLTYPLFLPALPFSSCLQFCLNATFKLPDDGEDFSATFFPCILGDSVVTCQRQPALGCVFKLVEINKTPRIKLSQDVEKITIPGKKEAYRLYGHDGHALIDLLVLPDEPEPQAGQRVLCRHPFLESKRAYVCPSRVQKLYKVFWDGKRVEIESPNLTNIRNKVKDSLSSLRQDHKRNLNPTPYKVGVSDALYHFIHDLWLENAPIGELS